MHRDREMHEEFARLAALTVGDLDHEFVRADVTLVWFVGQGVGAHPCDAVPCPLSNPVTDDLDRRSPGVRPVRAFARLIARHGQ